MSSTRKLYILSAVFFTVGAVLAVVKQQAVALAIFVTLTLMMLWIQARVDRVIEERRPSDRPASDD